VQDCKSLTSAKIFLWPLKSVKLLYILVHHVLAEKVYGESYVRFLFSTPRPGASDEARTTGGRSKWTKNRRFDNIIKSAIFGPFWGVGLPWGYYQIENSAHLLPMAERSKCHALAVSHVLYTWHPDLDKFKLKLEVEWVSIENRLTRLWLVWKCHF